MQYPNLIITCPITQWCQAISRHRADGKVTNAFLIISWTVNGFEYLFTDYTPFFNITFQDLARSFSNLQSGAIILLTYKNMILHIHDIEHLQWLLQNWGWPHKRHHIAHPQGWDMGCLLWGSAMKLTLLFISALHCINTLWPSDAVWRYHGSGSKLAWVMALLSDGIKPMLI